VGPTAGLDRCGKFSPYTGIRSQGRPARNESTVPTELSQPSELSPVRETAEHILIYRTFGGGGFNCCDSIQLGPQALR
jgi:hypothetical protein